MHVLDKRVLRDDVPLRQDSTLGVEPRNQSAILELPEEPELTEPWKAVQEAGGIVAGVVTIVDRNTGVREKIESAGLPYRYAVGLEDLGLS